MLDLEFDCDCLNLLCIVHDFVVQLCCNGNDSQTTRNVENSLDVMKSQTKVRQSWSCLRSRNVRLRRQFSSETDSDDSCTALHDRVLTNDKMCENNISSGRLESAEVSITAQNCMLPSHPVANMESTVRCYNEGGTPHKTNAVDYQLVSEKCQDCCSKFLNAIDNQSVDVTASRPTPATSRNPFHHCSNGELTYAQITEQTSKAFIENYNIAGKVIQARQASDSNSCIIEAPTYCPSDELFEEPVSYTDLLYTTVSHYGLCRILPPAGWLPHCEIADDVRFMTQIQYIHQLRSRCGPNALQLACLRNHLESKRIRLDQLPLIGGVEVDLVALAEAVKQSGGLTSVVSENSWSVVADLSKTVKCHRDLASRLSELYCRYLMSYDTLDIHEREQIELKTREEIHEKAASNNVDCFFKGKFRTLSEFVATANNVSSVHFKEQPTADEVEELYWRYVLDQRNHVVVQSAQLCASAFPTHASSPYSQHGWNFNVLNGSKLCLLRQYCETDIIAPRLDFAMMFATKCWSRSCHYLPCLHYLHKGADIIWYCVAADEADKFKQVARRLVPEITNIDNPGDWPRVMLSPLELVANGVNVTRIVQRSGQYIFVTPGCYTATVATGFCVSETIYMATSSWLPYGFEASEMLRCSSIPDIFSLSKLICSIALNLCRDSSEVSADVLARALPLMKTLFQREAELQSSLTSLGLSLSATGHDEHIRCDVCKTLCFLSMVVSEEDDVIYCLEHAAEYLRRMKNVKSYKLFYQFTEVRYIFLWLYKLLVDLKRT
jgi:hypothetical protein